MFEDLYLSGEYLKKNPTWHVGESPWKAREILRMMTRNTIVPETICEVGCGAGEVLKRLQEHMDSRCMLWGYEISPYAFELTKSRANEKLQFKLADIRQEKDVFFDLILVMDVVEHVEDCFNFLREIKPKSQYKIFHIPMDLSVQSILFGHLIEYRKAYGHIHYFTKEIALQLLKDVGYEIVDYFYTTETIEVQSNEVERNLLKRLRKLLGRIKRQFISRLQKLPGELLFAINEDVAVRIWGHWGQWRLLILAK
jgi:SAM-dependent methyltransferase